VNPLWAQAKAVRSEDCRGTLWFVSNSGDTGFGKSVRARCSERCFDGAISATGHLGARVSRAGVLRGAAPELEGCGKAAGGAARNPEKQAASVSLTLAW